MVQHIGHTRPAAGAARALAAILVFGIAFGYVEAAVVVYLRTIYQPLRERLNPQAAPGDLFPLIRADELRAEGPEYTRRLLVELGREAATLAMLAGMAWATASCFRTFFASFVIAFGIWDTFYYVFLKLLIDWPASVWTWDILFLLPVPWVGPVIAPLIVAAAMVIAGTTVWLREAAGRPLRPRAGDWAMVVAGGIVLVTAFCWDFRNTAAGGYPNPFNWPLFAVGLAVGVAGLVRPLRRGMPRRF